MEHLTHTFHFAELLTPDPERAARFYGALFGWQVRDAGGGYSMFHLAGRDVVGLRRRNGMRAHWASYVKVAALEPMVEKAVTLGGKVVTPPAETPGAARTCLLTDREGAVFGLWEPRGIDGTDVETGPGSLWWIELASGARDVARAFYTSLFPWTAETTMKYENGPLGYVVFRLGDRSTGGVFQFEPEWGLEPMWQPYFEVTDFNAAAAHACALGGEQGFWRDAPNAGRIGVIVDPDGALFLIAQPLSPAAGA